MFNLLSPTPVPRQLKSHECSPLWNSQAPCPLPSSPLMLSDEGFSCSFSLFPSHLLPGEGPFHFFQILLYSFKLGHFKTHPSSFSFLPPLYRDVCPHQFLMGLQCSFSLPPLLGRTDVPARAIHPPTTGLQLLFFQTARSEASSWQSS